MSQEIAVIAGVGPGLGWALARRFARAGMRVVAVARHTDKLKRLADAAQSSDLELRQCDVAEPVEVGELFARLEKEIGVPSVAVFNAGAYERGSVLELAPEALERCWRIGCFGGFLFGQAAARLMVSRGSGTLLFTGATASLRGGAGICCARGEKHRCCRRTRSLKPTSSFIDNTAARGRTSSISGPGSKNSRLLSRQCPSRNGREPARSGRSSSASKRSPKPGT